MLFGGYQENIESIDNVANDLLMTKMTFVNLFESQVATDSEFKFVFWVKYTVMNLIW